MRLPNIVVMAVILVVSVVGCGGPANNVAARSFVTEYGLGPDKWATAWLLTRYIDPDARLVVVGGADIAAAPGTRFDVPGAEYRRIGDRSAFEVARQAAGLSDPAVAALGAIVQDIEVEFWSASSISADAVEQGFRTLQMRFGRDKVSPDCYLAYFDRVYDSLQRRLGSGQSLAPADLEVDCAAVDFAAAGSSSLVPEVPVATVLEEMRRGKKVVFVDVREPDEFAESHIPGALNITLRDIRPETIAPLAGADYVVTYCVKDFRGFEMAKALRDAGIENATILNPYGIKGWIGAGLPLTGRKALPADEASIKLAQCAAAPADCAEQKNERGRI